MSQTAYRASDPTTGGIPIVVAIDATTVVQGQNIVITVALNEFSSSIPVTLTCEPPNSLTNMGTFPQKKQAQLYPATVTTEAAGSFTVTAATANGHLSSAIIVVLPGVAVVKQPASRT